MPSFGLPVKQARQSQDPHAQITAGRLRRRTRDKNIGTSGIMLVTYTAQFTLHLRPAIRAPLTPEPLDKPGQFDQILDTEWDSSCADRGHGILRRDTRPARRQRGQVSLQIAVEDPLFTPVGPLQHEVDFLPELRMERMRDPDGPRHIAGADCS